MTTQYLPLTEYSSKYRVSISTLRRRIKAEDIRFMFEDGKYLILDEPMSTHQRVHRPSQQASDETLMGAHAGAIVRESAPVFGFNSFGFQAENKESIKEASEEKSRSHSAFLMQNNQQQHEESVLAAANRLLTELKKAYSQILQEKEEQILILKEEMSDLKTLTKVLEAENERMKFGRR